MIVDAFPFFNELDLLDLRLNTLAPVADRFVLVEATKTHSGKPKPLHFEENKNRFLPFLDRIEHVVVDDWPPFETAWTYENHQRNCVVRGLSGVSSDDWILISDLDEIPNPDRIRICSRKPGRYRFDQTMYAYWLNMRCVTIPHWYGTRMLRADDFLHGLDSIPIPFNPNMLEAVNPGTTATKWRFAEDVGWTNVRSGGWHFTSLGGAEAVVLKAQSFAHTELDTPENGDPSRVRDMLVQGKGPMNHSRLATRPLDSSFPRYVLDRQDIFGKYVLRVPFLRLLQDAVRTAIYLGMCRTIDFIRPFLPGWIRPAMIRLRGWAGI